MKRTRNIALAVTAAALFTFSLSLNPALAQNVFETLQSKGTETFTNIRNISFILGGFGIVGLAVMAYFGRFQFKWLFALGGGLVLIAVAGAAINYVTTNAGTGTIANNPAWTDTMGTQ